MKTFLFSLATIFAMGNTTLANSIQNDTQSKPSLQIMNENLADQKIQVAILLDTSSSMDGLIDQAKSRLWNIVNTLTTLRYQGKKPSIEISLYEYGNDGLSAENGYIRQVTPLTSDLDLLSEKLFALRTNGGSEYCGQVIQVSTDELKWSKDSKSMKLIYIAGNETFDQGKVNYIEAISEAVKQGIYVNTIHCGDDYAGINGKWKDGAEKGKGEYFFIDHNQKIRYIPTPYDVRIDECNTRLNQTYIYYGAQGAVMKERQVQQDVMAEGVSMENKVTRTAAKANYSYSNASWDLVDALDQKDMDWKNLDKSTLPEKYRNLSNEALKKEVEKLQAERKLIQKEILELNQEREKFIQSELAKSGDQETDLGAAITQAVLKFANQKGYVQEK
ncbi:vWA domain-containing protein [Moheibacter stercoris]|uniref:VWFA domain-containing protein n=1 Tax=Moheibacter stercoris TaxID=1628251 RepID=A0ABV2LUW5_9FLAO